MLPALGCSLGGTSTSFLVSPLQLCLWNALFPLTCCRGAALARGPAVFCLEMGRLTAGPSGGCRPQAVSTVVADFGRCRQSGRFELLGASAHGSRQVLLLDDSC